MDPSFGKGYRDNNWRKKRETILCRDNYTCQCCGRTEQDGIKLQVHHLIYLRHCKPWEYPDYALITLCSGCHAAEHGHRMPNDGWKYDYEYEDEYGSIQCELCGTNLKYIHLLHHPDWGNILVGCECAGNLLAGSKIASKIKRERELRAQRLKRFVESSKWKNYEGRYYIEKDGIKINIWDNRKYFSISIKSDEEASYYRLKRKAKTLEEAKSIVFDELNPKQIPESQTYPSEEILVCQQPKNISDKKCLIRNICEKVILQNLFKLPPYKSIPQKEIKFEKVTKYKFGTTYKYDVSATHKSQKNNKLYDFYIKFLFGEQLTFDEIDNIRKNNIQFITIDCSPLLELDNLSMSIVSEYLFSANTCHVQWVYAPIYDNYLKNSNR